MIIHSQVVYWAQAWTADDLIVVLIFSLKKTNCLVFPLFQRINDYKKIPEKIFIKSIYLFMYDKLKQFWLDKCSLGQTGQLSGGTVCRSQAVRPCLIRWVLFNVDQNTVFDVK